MSFDPNAPITPLNTHAAEPVANATPAATAAQPTTAGPVSFTPEQQTKLDEIIRAAQGRAAAEVRQRLSEAEHKLKLTQAELQRAQAAAAPDATADQKLQVELDAERRKNAELTASMQRTARENTIREAARRENFVDLSDALRLVDIADDATPEQVADAVRQVANTKPHLIRGSVKPGSGSQPDNTGFPTTQLKPEDSYGRGARPGSAEALNSLSKSNPGAYKSLRAAAKSARLI